MRAFAALSLFVAASAFAADFTVAELLRTGRVLDHDSLIVATADAHEPDMCRGFNLTESQIKDFFRKAQAMAPDAMHTGFKWSPCEVVGHFLYQDQKFSFSINAASTGEIEVAPGKTLAFGCSDVCRSIFDYGYPVPAAPTAVAPASQTPH